MRRVLIGLLTTLPVLALAGGPLPPLEDYVGSERCGTCHEKMHADWKATFHSTVIQDARANPKAILGDFGRASVGFRREEVDRTIGGHWTQRYLTRVGDDYFALPKAWSVASQKWVDQDVWSWKKKPYSRYCVGCHTTRYDPSSRSFVEYGVGCEACHGPGRRHAESQGTGFILNPGDLPTDEQDLICASCHVRGTDPTGEYQFAAGYVPGRALHDYYVPGKLADDQAPRAAFLEVYRAWQERMRSGKPPSCDVCGIRQDSCDIKRPKSPEGESVASNCQDCHRFGDAYTAHTQHPVQVAFQCRDCHQRADLPNWSAADVHSLPYFLVHRREAYTANYSSACQGCHAEHTPEELVGELDQLYRPQRTTPAGLVN